jgi:hypothetical protein
MLHSIFSSSASAAAPGRGERSSMAVVAALDGMCRTSMNPSRVAATASRGILDSDRSTVVGAADALAGVACRHDWNP